jgi:hypothetical protein
VKKFQDYKLTVEGRTPSVSELRKFLELLAKLEREHDLVFFGSGCDKPGTHNCTEKIKACGCDWSKRVLNKKITLLSTWIGRQIPSLAKTTKMTRLVQARNEICKHTPTDLNQGKLVKFISDVQKYSGDLGIEAQKATPKTANSLDNPKGGKILLRKTLEEWTTRVCAVDRHKKFKNPAAECRVILTQAEDANSLDKIKGLRAYYDHFVVHKNSRLPEGGFTSEGGAGTSKMKKASKKVADGDGDDPEEGEPVLKVKASDSKSVGMVVGADSYVADFSDYEDEVDYLQSLREKAVRSLHKRQKLRDDADARLACFRSPHDLETAETPPPCEEVCYAECQDAELSATPELALLDLERNTKTVYTAHRGELKRSVRGQDAKL